MAGTKLREPLPAQWMLACNVEMNAPKHCFDGSRSQRLHSCSQWQQSPKERVAAGIAVVSFLALSSTKTWGLTPIISTTLHRRLEQNSLLPIPHRLLIDSRHPDDSFAQPSARTGGRQPPLSKPPSAKQIVSSGNNEETINNLSRRFSELDFLLQNYDGFDDESSPPERDEKRNDEPIQSSSPVCRIVTRSDRKLPTSRAMLPASLAQPPHVLRKLDDLFHAASHTETSRLHYFDTNGAASTRHPTRTNGKEETMLVELTRSCLDDAGFQLLSRRDLDLCEALNAGYLLRMSILPDVTRLDPGIAREFYPERFESEESKLEDENEDEFLFGGRVLVYWRGYSSEVTRGRLVLPKLDYLQASIVQRSASTLVDRLHVLERWIILKTILFCRSISKASLKLGKSIAENIPNKKLAASLRKRLANETRKDNNNIKALASKPTNRLFKLTRYGGSKIRFVGSPNPTDALDPFMICEQVECPPIDDYLKPNSEGHKSVVNGSDGALSRDVDRDMYQCITSAGLQCPYDQKASKKIEKQQPMQLLQRVSISSVVDVFSKGGRRSLLKSLFAKSKLVEPTYDEVVVVWRPQPPTDAAALPALVRPPALRPPKFVYDLADMFDIGGLPERKTNTIQDGDKSKRLAKRRSLEIRSFSAVPMANVLAVLPQTKLVFRPADAFVFDSISVISFLLVIGSQRFDSPKLDLLALVSVTLWLIRTVFRYSNKLARYDLLVKTFLTSKISHRNRSALRNLMSEAGTQRAVRASLTHSWLCQLRENGRLQDMSRDDLLRQGGAKVSNLLKKDDFYREIPVDMDDTLRDLEELGLLTVTQDGKTIQVVSQSWSVRRVLKSCWNKVFDGSMTLRFYGAAVSRHRGRQLERIVNRGSAEDLRP